MTRVFATELRGQPAALGVLPRRNASDTGSFSRRNFANSHAGHQFSSVAVAGNKIPSKLPSPLRHAVSARLYEEDLSGQPSADATDDTADTAVPMSDTDLSGTKQGATGCDTAAAKVTTATLNTDDCTKDCSTKHENKHAADIAPCCEKAGAASKAAKSESEKADIQTKFNDWMLSNKPFLECRAYDESISCGNAKHKKANCEKNSYGKCCKSLVWYIRSATLGKTAACAQAEKKLSDCPFS